MMFLSWGQPVTVRRRAAPAGTQKLGTDATGSRDFCTTYVLRPPNERSRRFYLWSVLALSPLKSTGWGWWTIPGSNHLGLLAAG